MEQLQLAARKAIEDCMGAKPGERLLLLTDTGRLPLTRAFMQAGEALGIETVMACGPEQLSGEMPALCEAALERADVALMITTGSFTHTRARAAATERGCRIASMPSVTEDIVLTALNADYDEMERIGELLAGRLSAADEIVVRTALGTSLTLHCQGRSGIADTGRLTRPGAFGNLPAGEAMVAPEETRAEGVLVVDGVISDFKVMEAPLALTFHEGRIVKAEGPDAGAFEEFLSAFSPTARSVCEFGIGTNAACEIMGNSLVDEKVFGTIHIACGNNLFMGGQQDGDMHYDLIIRRPTVLLDGDTILEEGRHVYGQAPAGR